MITREERLALALCDIADLLRGEITLSECGLDGDGFVEDKALELLDAINHDVCAILTADWIDSHPEMCGFARWATRVDS